MTVLHIITGLNVGGAETMLAKLVEQGCGDAALRPHVLSLLAPGRLAPRIRSRNVPVNTLDMQAGRPGVRDLVRLAAFARRVRPALIQGWMHHGNLAASLASLALATRPPVVWNVRHSLVDIAHEKPLSRAVLRLGRMLSTSPAAIIYNSQVAARQYADFGFAADRTVVIPNGFDCAQFKPSATARGVIERTFGIGSDVTIVAVVARYHPMKDHAMLVEAVRRARTTGHDLHLLMVGTGMDQPPPDLARAIADALPPSRVTLAGERQDVAAWIGGADIVALPSAWGEGFPNILGEAMASGVPCVATNVGDSAMIVGTFGRVVAPRDPAAFASALAWLTEMGTDARARLGAAARERIIANFSLDVVAGRYAALYQSVLDSRPTNWPGTMVAARPTVTTPKTA